MADPPPASADGAVAMAIVQGLSLIFFEGRPRPLVEGNPPKVVVVIYIVRGFERFCFNEQWIKKLENVLLCIVLFNLKGGFIKKSLFFRF